MSTHATADERGATLHEAARSTCAVCSSPRVRPFMIAPDNGHLRDQDVRLPVYRCADCDLFFLNPPPPGEIGREYFAEQYKTDMAANPYYTDEFKDRVGDIRAKLLEQYGVSAGRLLDVGCAKGHFVRSAKNAGWDAWGVELDEGACEYARTHLGLDTVFAGSVDHPNLPDQFDAVTLWDVIEHVHDPLECLRGVAGKLRESGWLVVRTGNIRSWAFDRNRRKWWAFGSDHRFYFSPGSLTRALELSGFTVVGVLNQEKAERPEKRQAPGLTDTSLSDGLRAIGKSPLKVARVGSYLAAKVRRLAGERKHGEHYMTSIMTVVARKT
jgi:SAM-dependent methyltransferase